MTPENVVAICSDCTSYGDRAPFLPGESFPEMSRVATSPIRNPVYGAIRQILRDLGFDSHRYGTEAWNPLGDIVKPGDRVFIKPNFVLHRNIGESAFGHTDVECIVTHGSLIRAICDYAAKALQGTGTVVIGDCPVQGANWDELCRITQVVDVIADLRKCWPGIQFDLRDYRLATAKTFGGWVSGRVERQQIPGQYCEVELGQRSLFAEWGSQSPRYGVSQYSGRRMQDAHSSTRNAYLVSRDMLDADVFINVPKLKTHQKVGFTCALKNLIGMNGHKDYLPHFRVGSPKDGGDEYPDGSRLWDLYWALVHRDWERDSGSIKLLYKLASVLAGGTYRFLSGQRHRSWLGGGSWYGNDTLWRTILDLNRVLFYWDRGASTMGSTRRKDQRYLCIVDGVVGGHREGPLAPAPIKSGWILGGTNPIAVDLTSSVLIGFQHEKIRYLAEALKLTDLRLWPYGAPDVTVLEGGRVLQHDDLAQRSKPFEPSLGYSEYLRPSEPS